MCIYYTEDKYIPADHFICEVCGDGMCEECYNEDKEHTEHIHLPLEACDKEEEQAIIDACNGIEPEYLCWRCYYNIVKNTKGQ